MKMREHLLVCLAEEANEISHIVSKSLRFGLSEVNVLEPKGPNNYQRLEAELNDLQAVISLLVFKGVIREDWFSPSAQADKINKLEKFVAYAKDECKTIQEP